MWYLYKGKLYINFRTSIRAHWLENLDQNIALAEARWSKWYGSLQSGPQNTQCFPGTFRSCMQSSAGWTPEMREAYTSESLLALNTTLGA